jgi:hypothetical protein
MFRLKTLGHSNQETAERLLESYPDAHGDPATGIVLSTLLVIAFGAGLFCGLFARAIWMLFTSFHLHA